MEVEAQNMDVIQEKLGCRECCPAEEAVEEEIEEEIYADTCAARRRFGSICPCTDLETSLQVRC